MDNSVSKTPFPNDNRTPTHTPKIDAVIPYIHQPDGWESLRYVLRALDENFVDLGKLWLIGDCPPWIDRTTVQLQEKRVEYSPSISVRNFNYCNSIFMAGTTSDLSNPFLFLTDDEYILRPRTGEDFKKTILIREDLGKFTQDQRLFGVRTEWQKLLWKTADKLTAFGYPIINYETHTPKLIDKKKLLSCFALFGYGDGSLIWQTAYFNMFPPGPTAHLSEKTDLKAGFYSLTEPGMIKSRADAAVFLNHNDNAVNEHLIDYITKRFPNPSRFELKS